VTDITACSFAAGIQAEHKHPSRSSFAGQHSMAVRGKDCRPPWERFGRTMIPEVTEIMTQSTAATPCKTDFLTRAARRGASICRMRDALRHKSMNILQS